MDTLDVGGGFPSGSISSRLFECLSKVKDDPLGYRVIAEPGRHFSSFSCHLVFRVIKNILSIFYIGSCKKI